MKIERKFAQGTKVPESKTKDEIEHMVRKRGADQFMTYSDSSSFSLVFGLDGLLYRFTVPMPDVEECKKRAYNVAATRGSGKRHLDDFEAITAERARLWRALKLNIQAKFVAIDDGITSVEQEFLPYVVTEDQRTVYEKVGPEIRAAAMNGRMPKALPWSGAK